MKEWIYLIFITFLPGIELRGSIPLAILHYNKNIFLSSAIIICVNILLIPIVFLMWQLIIFLAEEITIVDKYLNYVRKRARSLVDKYGFWGLVILVAIPLPGTGAYTGTLAAELFAMKKRKAFLAIGLGVIIAGIIVTLASIGTIPLKGINK
ncbi:MAG: small multi-drug export protein [Caldisericota bacterium]|nr:small multi-drug export protein [Caldisericota bacterium]